MGRLKSKACVFSDRINTMWVCTFPPQKKAPLLGKKGQTPPGELFANTEIAHTSRKGNNLTALPKTLKMPWKLDKSECLRDILSSCLLSCNSWTLLILLMKTLFSFWILGRTSCKCLKMLWSFSHWTMVGTKEGSKQLGNNPWVANEQQGCSACGTTSVDTLQAPGMTPLPGLLKNLLVPSNSCGVSPAHKKRNEENKRCFWTAQMAHLYYLITSFNSWTYLMEGWELIWFSDLHTDAH